PYHKAHTDGAALDDEYFKIPQQLRDRALQLHLDNGSRIIGLPCSPDTIVGYSAANLIVIDEAARVSDDLYKALRPRLAVSKGRLVALTTPKGRRGWFYEEWDKCAQALAAGRPAVWKRITVKATECPRIPKGFLEEERQSLGERWFRQEYEGS